MEVNDGVKSDNIEKKLSQRNPAFFCLDYYYNFFLPTPPLRQDMTQGQLFLNGV